MRRWQLDADCGASIHAQHALGRHDIPAISQLDVHHARIDYDGLANGQGSQITSANPRMQSGRAA